MKYLRWVGTEFVYFLDIPCPDLPERPSDSVAVGTEPIAAHGPNLSSGICIRPAELTRKLLKGAMYMEVPIDRIVSRDATHKTVISGDSLARLLVPWARDLFLNRERFSTDLARQQRNREAKSFLKGEIEAFDGAVIQEPSLLDDNALLALRVFMSSLSKCAQQAWDGENFDWFFNPGIMYKVHGILRQRFESRWGSWMARDMERILTAGIPFVAYAISRPPTLNRVATGTAIVNVARDPKKIPHVIPECTCTFVAPALEAVCKSLLEGDVPVVAFDGTDLIVRPASDGPYVAISHVWADGLGSSTEHGLPRCQVERLDAIVRKLVPDGAFWHDGLCVPTEKPTWQLAIKLLARTYAGADKVLVIDGGIRNQYSLGKPIEECLLRIATSGWMQRIWTLQEALLPRELHFEVADGVVNCSIFDGQASSMASTLVSVLQYRWREGGLGFQNHLNHRPRCTLHDLVGLMRLRSTSCPEDEPLAIAGLLGIDAEKLAGLPNGEERMKALLIEVREVPHNLLLFGWFAERLSVANFTWAPASLSQVLWPGHREDIAICTEEGLFGDFTLVRFSDVAGKHSLRGAVSADLDVSIRESRCRERNGRLSPPAIGDDGIGFFQLMLSPRIDGVPTYNAFLTNCSITELRSGREYATAIVHVTSEATSTGGGIIPRCKYVGPGKILWARPTQAMDTRWSQDCMQATIEMTAVNVV